MSSEAARAQILDIMAREEERLRAREQALTLKPRSTRRRVGSSVAFSIRLDKDELAALEGRALDANIKPTVLARNLIRVGLGSASGAELAAAVDRLDAALAEVRALIG